MHPTFATVPEALGHWARARPAARALSAGTEELSYAEVADAVDALAARLAGAGVEAGDRLALLASNRVEWALGFLAGLRSGAVVVPLNTHLSPREIGRQLDACDPRLVLTDAGLLPLLERANARCSIMLLERDAPPARSIWGRAPGTLPAGPPVPGAPALIAFTSGSTGPPKGAVISHEALMHSAGAFAEALGTGCDDSTLVLVPLFHNTGYVDQLAHMLLVGGAVDLMGDFGTTRAIEALSRRPATYLIAVPSVYRLLMLSDDADVAFRSCRIAAYGGSLTPPAWLDELGERWPAMGLYNIYGLTEFTSMSHVRSPDDDSAPGSIGRPVAGVRQQLMDSDEQPVTRPNEPGELWIAGPMRMSGYWQGAGATRDVFRGDWLRTGDIAYLDEAGCATVVGRSADVINRGGEKIYPSQVEAALCELPDVVEAAVVGVTHPIFQNRVVACVVTRRHAALDEEAARGHLLDRVARYAVPEEYRLVPALPRNAAGKVDRSQVRALFAAEPTECNGRE